MDIEDIIFYGLKGRYGDFVAYAFVDFKRHQKRIESKTAKKSIVEFLADARYSTLLTDDNYLEEAIEEITSYD